jgi:hypothetical protein
VTDVSPHAAADYEFVHRVIELMVRECFHQPDKNVYPLPGARGEQTLVRELEIDRVIKKEPSIVIIGWTGEAIHYIPHTDAKRAQNCL